MIKECSSYIKSVMAEPEEQKEPDEDPVDHQID